MTLGIPVIVGTEREGRQTIKVARWIHARLAARDGVESAFVDPADVPLGNLVNREWEMDPRPQALTDLVRTVDEADGFVVVSPEYNHGYPGALKNVLDFIYDEWNRKPFGVVSVSAGSFGGQRMVEALWSVVIALQGVPVPRTLAVPRVADAFDAHGEPTDLKFRERADRFLDLVMEYAQKCRALRA